MQLPEDIPKRQCFVNLFDILGFSDIVRNDKLENVWRAKHEIKSKASFIKDNLESLFNQQIIDIVTFSDTFLMYTANHHNTAQGEMDKYFNALLGVCDALFHTANDNGIPIRGAITAGELIVEDGIYIGKPIVEAYKMEQQQDWIGCWINDSAMELLSKNSIDYYMNGNLIMKYKLPFKSGEIKDCYVFNWVNLPFEGDYDHNFLKIKTEHDWTIERKHRNTRDFIKFVQNKIGA